MSDISSPKWFKERKYRHLDRPVTADFALKITDPSSVANHSFLPLLRYTDIKIVKGKKKRRPICYASHRDACIYSCYAYQLNGILEKIYSDEGIGDNVIAYRSLGKNNADFAKDAYSYCMDNAPVEILAFDVVGFFENLNHNLLRGRLRQVLGDQKLSKDWFNVFRSVTRYHCVAIKELKEHPVFASRFEEKFHDRIASIQEIKKEKVRIYPNKGIDKGIENDGKRGIPQGTPISATLSNLYMIDFDIALKVYCSRINAFYRRYSDDILIICKPEQGDGVEAEVKRLIEQEKLEVEDNKTERTCFKGNASDSCSRKPVQYLGFDLHESGPTIRGRSLARHLHRIHRSVKRLRVIGLKKIKSGEWKKIHTKKIYRRLTYIQIPGKGGLRALRNFPSYARRSAKIFGGNEKISNQTKRVESKALEKIREIKALIRR